MIFTIYINFNAIHIKKVLKDLRLEMEFFTLCLLSNFTFALRGYS